MLRALMKPARFLIERDHGKQRLRWRDGEGRRRKKKGGEQRGL